MEILLAAGVQPNRRYLGHSRDWIGKHITPLQYAIENRQDEAILLLLDADFLTCRRDSYVLTNVMEYHYQPSSRIVTATIEAMVRRSNRLRSLAIAHLSHCELDRLCIYHKDEQIQILDAYAAPTAKALKNVGVKIPEALEPGLFVSTVYHCSWYLSAVLTAELADRLWSSGFHDTNIYDEDGFTPLHQACVWLELDTVNWLMSHGGDPTTVVRGHSLNAFHLLSDGFRYYELYSLPAKQSYRNAFAYRDAFARIANACGASCPDDCRCACSPQGCTPTTILLRAETLTWSEKVDLFFSWCRFVDLSPDAIETCCLEFARVETFERVGITHVCCKIEGWAVSAPMPQDTVEEIQDEESEMIDQLESWMILYGEERAKFEGSARQFLGKWSDMLKDVLDVPALFEEYWRQKCMEDKEIRMPDYFTKPSYVEEMDEDQDCISDS